MSTVGPVRSITPGRCRITNRPPSAASLGHAHYGALLLSGKGSERDADAGRGWIEKAAKTGLATAQHSLAKLARKGIGGARDLDIFLQWAQAAAAKEFAPALHDLGCSIWSRTMAARLTLRGPRDICGGPH